MMQDAAVGVRRATDRSHSRVREEQPDVLDWLENGRLTLVDERREPVPAERWLQLPAEVRARVLTDFEQVVRSNTKAAIIFLR